MSEFAFLPSERPSTFGKAKVLEDHATIPVIQGQIELIEELRTDARVARATIA